MILKQQIPDIIALEIDLLLAKFLKFLLCECFLCHSWLLLLLVGFFRCCLFHLLLYNEIVMDGFAEIYGALSMSLVLLQFDFVVSLTHSLWP